MDLSVNDDGFGLNFSFDVSVLGDGEGTIRADLTFDTTVDEEVVGETNGSFDVDVVAEDVALSARCAGSWS